MRIRECLFGLSMAVLAMGFQSCANGVRPENRSGHDLWLGDITSTPQAVNKSLLSEYDNKLGDEGFRISRNDRGESVIYANTEAGLMYGTYHLKRLMDCNVKMTSDILEVPAYKYRILNHWDNPNGTVERGYAGKSLWKWDELPGQIRPEYEEYARANASIGINGTVLNNVNADARMLSREYLEKVKVLADIFRPYNIKVYLSLNFAAPKHLAGLKTSDPLDKDVIKWWNDKVAEIYSIIPDFGGFLVKANSEGQSGPQDYGRTHADGANMIADAVKPYGGIVMWRAFVYAAESPDRAKQAVEEFMPLDGQFHDNVIIQIKNGPVDFQPREPFSPLFGQLEHTNVMAEMQITQEYLGHNLNLKSTSLKTISGFAGMSVSSVYAPYISANQVVFNENAGLTVSGELLVSTNSPIKFGAWAFPSTTPPSFSSLRLTRASIPTAPHPDEFRAIMTSGWQTK